MRSIDIIFRSLLLCTIILVVLVLLTATVPPVSRDALTHHLIVPKLWIEKGLFAELPSITFSYYPMNLDLLYMIPLYLGNDIIPKYVHFAFALATAVLIYCFLKERLDKAYAISGALFFLSIPVVVKLSTVVYVDLGLIFFSTAALLCLIMWAEKPSSLKMLIFSAISCGLAMGTKYNGLISFFILSLFVPLVYLWCHLGRIQSRRRSALQFSAIGYGLLFVGISLFVFSPWMLRNAYLTGNPIYPLFNRVFEVPDEDAQNVDNADSGGAEQSSKSQPSGKWSHFTVRKMVYGESLTQTLTIPLRVFFEGQDDNPKYFDGKLSPFLLLLPLVLLIPNGSPSRNRKFEYRMLFYFSLLYLLFVFVQIDMRIRWISPIVGPLAILSVFGLHRMFNMVSGIRHVILGSILRFVIIVIAIVPLVLNAGYAFALFKKSDCLNYISGNIDRDTYITNFRPEYDLIQYANKQLSPNVKILSLFIGNRIYYFDRCFINDQEKLNRAVSNATSTNEISDLLKTDDITHILFRFDLMKFYIGKNFNVPQKEMLMEFFQKNGKMIRLHGGYGLFELSCYPSALDLKPAIK